MEEIGAKSILQRSARPGDWFGADYTVNLYRGCCHGCIYCDSRSDCYGIEEFDQVRVKRDCIPILERELRAKRGRGLVAMGAMSDPYNPGERELGVTRKALELLLRYGFGAGLATKSGLVTRDGDVLAEIARREAGVVKVTVTVADDGLARILEPHAPAPSTRLKAAEELSSRGIFTGILLMPVLPFLTDRADQVREVVRQAKAHGARFVYPAFGVTLRDSQRAYFYRQLDRYEPGLSQRYRRTYGERYFCPIPNYREIIPLFEGECRTQGLLCRMRDIIEASRAPYRREQMRFF